MSEKRKLTDEDIEILISEVQTRPALWNDRHNNFKNSVLTRKLWEEVSRPLNMSGDECKKKWKSLKDTFRKKLQNPVSKSGSAASPPRKKWKFETLMGFIRDVILPSPMVGSLASSSVEEEDLTLDSELADQEPSQQQSTIHSASQDETFSRPHRSIKSMRKKEELEKRMMEMEEKKLNVMLNLGKQTDDLKGEDYHFFLSLLPHIHRLNNLEKLELRSKIHNCVLEAVREHETRKALLGFSAPHESASSSGSLELQRTESSTSMNQLPQSFEPNNNDHDTCEVVYITDI